MSNRLILNSLLRRKTLIPSPIFHRSISKLQLCIFFSSETLHPLFSTSPLLKKTLIPSSVYHNRSISTIPTILSILDRGWTRMEELPPNIQQVIKPFKELGDPWYLESEFFTKLDSYSDILPRLDDIYKTSDNKVPKSFDSRFENVNVWVRAFLHPDNNNKVRFEADSDSAVARGFASILCHTLSGRPLTELTPDFFALLNWTLKSSWECPRLSNHFDFFNMLELMQKKCLLLAAKEIVLRPVELEVEEHSHFNVNEFQGKSLDDLPLSISINLKAFFSQQP